MSDYNAALALSRGLHNFLANQVHIQDHLGNPPRLYDDPPEDPIFPYLTYGPLRSENISAEGAVITQHVLSLHLWSRYNGRTETLELVGLVSGLIETGQIEMSGATLISRHIILTDVFRATDGLTQHGIIRMRLTTERELESI